MDPHGRIVVDNKICMGKPCIKGTRLKVEFVLELLATGWTYDQIRDEYDLTEEDILAVLDYARQIVANERVFKLSTNP